MEEIATRIYVTQSEICNFNIEFVIEQEVLGLEVSVCNA
jgi:hypothetical protein